MGILHLQPKSNSLMTCLKSEIATQVFHPYGVDFEKNKMYFKVLVTLDKYKLAQSV